MKTLMLFLAVFPSCARLLADDVTMVWTPSAPNEFVLRYYVYFRPFPLVTNWIRWPLSVTTNSISVTPMLSMADRVYQFCVSAENDVGEGPMSDPVTYTNKVALRPSKPTGLKLIKLP